MLTATTVQPSSRFNFLNIFRRDYAHYEGVPRINIYLLRLLFTLMFYKIMWLAVVSYPLWVKNELAGSPAEEMTYVFIWVIFPIVSMPWRYFFRAFILGKEGA